MSSSVTDSGANSGKLLVHVSENGHSFQLDCHEGMLVEDVMRLIESVTGINCNDQVILSLDVRLESQRPLSVYKLPADDREVFLFDRTRLQSNSLPPPPEQIDILDLVEPPSPSSSQDSHPLDDASDPALKALPSYEREFRYHYHKAHTIYSSTVMKYECCERLLREQKVQERAIEVARGNLDQYYKMITQNYTDFMKRYSQQHRVHSDLLMNLDRDIEKLRSVKLHPALQTSNRKCLLDFVKEDNLRKSAENCSSSHSQFENKVLQFKDIFNEVKRKVEDLFSSRASFSIKILELNIKEHQRYINDQKSIMQSLSKDVDTVKKLVDDCLSCQLSSSLRPHDAVSALGPMYDVHDKNHLPRMQACDRAVSKLLDICKDKKNQMNNFLHYYMQKIAYNSYIIKDVKLQFPVFKEAMGRQDDLFMDLKLVRGIGPAYRACLSEVVRRKACMKLYMGMAGQMAERLARKRDDEVRRREMFLTEHGGYFPRDVIESMGLNDIPNPCDVHISPYDECLIDVGILDLDRYAPEYLLGFPWKNEKQGITKDSSIKSIGALSSVEAEESSKDTFESYGSGELLEGSELVEIAGTSKLEVENAKLKAELASALATICSFSSEYDLSDDSKLDSVLKNAAEKTAEALHLKDEYGKQLQQMLKTKQMQCESYERRIKELEQRLSDQYVQGQSLSINVVSDFSVSAVKNGDCKPQILGGPEAPALCISTSEPMDEVSCISNSLDVKLGLFAEQPGRVREAVDENMLDSRGDQNPHLDSSMMEPNREEFQDNDKYVRDKVVGQMGISLTNSSTAESMPRSLNVLPCETVENPNLESNLPNGLLLELQNALADKTILLSETETKLKGTLEEVVVLKRELEASRKLLDESQMNCAHLENCLHEAREEAQTHLCAAARRASEYTALRTSAVKMRGHVERLKSYVFAPNGVAAFAHSLRTLAQSLANSGSDNENDGTNEFRQCIWAIAERVGHLVKQHEKYAKLEATNEQLVKELEEKKELVKTLYTKHQLEKQANKEKISFGRMEVHEIAAFVRNAAGHYEAINRNCANYYLSAESVALFADNLLTRSNYIVGQIVHIEHQTVKPSPPSPRRDHGTVDQTDCVISDSGTDRLTLNSGLSSNPYGLPVGCEYFIVTVAMLPDTAIHSTAS
ncbi:autophagy-related protein 11 isoform X1 [Cucumis melo var. makuwa]|uniref:Autophagy-related protein 11 isoform X1 n=1 Tax=Cucumis melo var. makuwa TaxID=1194695 RepID=A0A5A7TIE5_CUCMM|nr:autophagy-related protein 11 isoform X1 [Cucumis melo var. makuwa]